MCPTKFFDKSACATQTVTSSRNAADVPDTTTSRPVVEVVRDQKSQNAARPALVLDAASALTSLVQQPPPLAVSSDASSRCIGKDVSADPDTEETITKTALPCKLQTQAALNGKRASTFTASTFPQKLMQILTEQEKLAREGGDEPAIKWLPCGRAFVVCNPNRFTLEVLPNFFKQTEFSSFTRKLYWWGFKKTTRGTNCDSFCHDFFLRDDPDLCSRMKGRSTSAPKRLGRQIKKTVKKALRTPVSTEKSTSSKPRDVFMESPQVQRHVTKFSSAYGVTPHPPLSSALEPASRLSPNTTLLGLPRTTLAPFAPRLQGSMLTSPSMGGKLGHLVPQGISTKHLVMGAPPAALARYAMEVARPPAPSQDTARLATQYLISSAPVPVQLKQQSVIVVHHHHIGGRTYLSTQPHL